METVLFALLCLLCAQLCFVNGDFNLVVLHTSDVHARVEQTNKYSAKCSEDDANEGKCYGGVARRHTAIQEIRNNHSNVLLLDAGDEFQGSIWFSYYNGSEASKFMNALGYDAMCLGNHEFDRGASVLLSPFLENVTFPVLACNIEFPGYPQVQARIQKHTIFDVSGEKVGVIGYITKDTQFLVDPKLLDGIIFNDISPCIKASIKTLQDQGVNKIIALGHSGYPSGLEVAAIPGVDIVVEGHSNTFLYNGAPPSNEKPVGRYPTVVAQSDGGEALVYTAYAYGKYLGVADVTFDDAGRVKQYQGNPILLDNTWKQDSMILAEVELLRTPLLQFTETVVGESYVVLKGEKEDCRLGECNLGNLMTDAILDHQLKADTNQGWSDVSMVIWNGGGIRITLDKGPITTGNILEVHPFRNTVERIWITGDTLKEALEHSASDMNPDDPGGRFLQVSGIRVVYEPSQPEGSRVKDVQVMCTECDFPQFEPLEMDKTYTIFAPDFIINGGDGYDMIRDNLIRREPIGVVVTDSLEYYISKTSPVYPGVEGRITILHTDPQSGESKPEKKVSNLDQDDVETALFLLVAVCFVLCLVVILLLLNYCGIKKQLKKMQDKLSTA